MHKEKLKELKLREVEILERCKIKERDIEAAAFEHRQKVLNELEMLRYKEQESKKTVEMELLMIRNERDKLFQKEKEADLKLKDLNLLKAALEKKTQSDIDEYKRNYESKFEDEKRDIQIRRMQLEEDEHRFALNKDKFLTTQKDKTQLEKEHFALREKFEKLDIEHDKMMKDYIEIKDQLKVLSNNGMRDNEIISSKTVEARNYGNEAKTLRELLEAQKQQMSNERQTNQEVIENLKYQLKEQKEILSQTKKRYDDEIERIINDTESQKETYKSMYRQEEHKLKNEITHLNNKIECEQHLAKELTLVNDKLMKDHSHLSSAIGIEGVRRGEAATHGVRQPDFLTAHGVPLLSGFGDSQLGEEYLARQRAWDDLDNETRGVKREIGKVGLVPIADCIYQPHYQLDQDESIDEDDFEPLEVKEPRVKFDNKPVDDGFKEERKDSKKSPKKPKVTMEEIDRLEREKKEKERAERERQQRLESERERQRKDALERERRKKEEQDKKERKLKEEQDRRERERKIKEEAKISTPNVVHPISASVKNPFAKKMGGGKKLDPISQPEPNIGIYNPQKQPSTGVDELIPDNYDLGFGDDKKKESIDEDISNEYSSGFVEEDPNEEFIF
jgi:hypothetical protein